MADSSSGRFTRRVLLTAGLAVGTAVTGVAIANARIGAPVLDRVENALARVVPHAHAQQAQRRFQPRRRYRPVEVFFCASSRLAQLPNCLAWHILREPLLRADFLP